MKNKKINTGYKFNIHSNNFFIAVILFLCVFGLISVYNSSSFSALNEFNDKYYFLKEQAKWMLLGFIFLLICQKIPYKKWYPLSIILLLISLFLLILILIPGFGLNVKGARRWLPFGGQPSELAKLSLVIYLSAWFSGKEKGRFTAFLILCGVILFLIMLQPDMGTAVVIAGIALVLYFLSEAPLKHFLLIILSTPVLLYFLIRIAPYRMDRFLTFLDNTLDPLGKSYHLRQVLIGLGSGGFWGIGLGKSRQKFSYIPESSTDSIFAIIAEEVGFLGSLFIILLFVFILYKGFIISKNSPDKFAKLLSAGIASWIGIQAIINLGSMVGLLPLTGIPLPFFSYGGSSILVTLIAMGILLNLNSYSKKR